jgi:hypothetical protein
MFLFFLFSLQVCYLRLEENVLHVVYVFVFFILMVLVGYMHCKEEEDDVHGNPFSEDGESLEGDEGNEAESESEDTNKLDSTPLWKYVTKIEGGRGGGNIKLMCEKDCHGVNLTSILILV